MARTAAATLHEDSTTRIIKLVSYVCLGAFALACLFPFALMISSSFMNEQEILLEGYKLIPNTFSLKAYEMLLNNSSALGKAYGVTIFITVVGTAFGLFMMSMAGYVLNRKDFKYRNFFSFLIYFTTLFSGGLIPTYILMVKYLHMKDSLFALILPTVVAAWSIFLMRNFMKAIPDSLYESATIDGAGDFRIYWQVFMPLAVPSLATIGLFSALGFWNEWYHGMLYIQTPDKYPLQYFLQRMINQTNIQALINQGVVIDAAALPTQSIKMATAVLATGPIILLYPFAQRYFVSGLTIGAVKG
ncbi:carbohydrate ABC transporter permease [Paenibacillus sp. IB182496]|uniref:Carbohydrate ABC transporter permease n=1 Tax=Paenibacillus sabuli TaxID=2772509 RepID=A0A927BWF7_9BACL|nr:carbohydrate ABC transporter permease [Paenibacillus sabuli]MBD2846608.1 carbohydrate ABC transporter permease [Paenibacillus sabuli]